MSKKWKVGILVVVSLSLMAGVALAAWALTKSANVQGVVEGTFTMNVSASSCTPAIEGQVGNCTLPVRNDSSATIQWGVWPIVTADREDVSIGNVQRPAGTIEPGMSRNVTWTYTPQVGAEPGAVNFTVTVEMTGG